jgi:hypothetical protein
VRLALLDHKVYPDRLAHRVYLDPLVLLVLLEQLVSRDHKVHRVYMV